MEFTVLDSFKKEYQHFTGMAQNQESHIRENIITMNPTFEYTLSVHDEHQIWEDNSYKSNLYEDYIIEYNKTAQIALKDHIKPV